MPISPCDEEPRTNPGRTTGPDGRGDAVAYLDSELYVTSLHQARFSWDGHDYASGKLTLGSGLRN